MYFFRGRHPYYLTLKNLHLLNNFCGVHHSGMPEPVFTCWSRPLSFRIYPASLRNRPGWTAPEADDLFRLIVPISMPLLATVAIFTSVGHWNSWCESAFFVQDKSLRTMAYLMMAVINQSSSKTSAASAPKWRRRAVRPQRFPSSLRR